ncbi:MAG: sensor histidine kinase [Clostridia bacterium]|nr:sensor histidine kinase [Clostridia bacterium]
MKELSLNILDITENSAKARATLIEIELSESENELVMKISDNGVGMTEETLASVINPFYTTRTTRKVGMGIPLLKLAAEQTGGRIEIASRHFQQFPADHGTTVSAFFNKNHIDFTPLGDVASTLVTLIQGHPEIDFVFLHKNGHSSVTLDTREMREVLGDVPLDSYEVLLWIKESLTEQYDGFN